MNMLYNARVSGISRTSSLSLGELRDVFCELFGEMWPQDILRTSHIVCNSAGDTRDIIIITIHIALLSIR